MVLASLGGKGLNKVKLFCVTVLGRVNCYLT